MSADNTRTARVVQMHQSQMNQPALCAIVKPIPISMIKTMIFSVAVSVSNKKMLGRLFMLDIPKLTELSFDGKRHVYSIKGEELPSVTTVMRPLSNAYYGGIDEGILQAAAQRGTAVHEAIENYLTFGIDDVASEHTGYYKAFKSWLDEKKPQIISTEGKIYHKILRYAGTSDLSCIMDGEAVCIDFKTSSQIVEMLVRVQLEAYSRAFESHGVKHQSKAVVHLQKDGRWDMKMFPSGDLEAWETFGGLLTVHNYIKKYRR